MSETQAKTGARSGRWLYVWWLTALLALVLVAHACGAPDEPDPTPSVSPSDVPAATISVMVVSSLTPTSSSPAAALASLPTVVPQPVTTPTPFPDEQEIVGAILGRGRQEDAEHWVTHLITGSFTAPGADELLALVGNIGDHDEVRWVVVGQMEDCWRMLGVSEWLGSGFDAPPSFYLSPDLLDFDDDGQQEVLNHYFRMQWGWTTATDILYRWDGHTLARVWRVDTILDNTLADNQEVPQPYREDYWAEWGWVDLNGDALDEILLREQVAFYPADGARWEDDCPVLGEETWERAFRWDGEALRPYAPDGPSVAFAYTVLGDLWLWQDRAAHPLGVEHVREFHWSPDGLRLAWWAQPPAGDVSQGATLGIYDFEVDAQQEFSLEGELSVLHWTPDGRLVYTLPDLPPTLLDPGTGQQEPLPAPSLGDWSPDGSRIAYERDGNLYVYDLSAEQEHLLVAAPEGAGARVGFPSLAWSPRGDWIACYLANEDSAWVGLVAPDLSAPLSSFDLLEAFDGREAPALQFAWSPDGSYLAVLTTGDPRLAQRPTVLYLAEMPDDGEGVGRPEWREMLQLEAVTHTARLAWSPCGDRVALVAGNEVWEATLLKQTRGITVGRTMSRSFSIPEPEWTMLEWAPDGSGFLVGLEWVYDEQLYWFPAGSADPVLLLADFLGAARWAPRIVEPRACPRSLPSMVVVDYGSDDPHLHFVGGDGSDVVVSAMGEVRYTSFQVGGGRVFYDYRYADRSGVTSLVIPNVPGSCHPPLVSPDGSQLAWLCEDSPPDWSALVGESAEIPFRLIITDEQGRNPREVWSHVETGPEYRSIRPISWRADGEMIYLSQPKYGAAWAYFEYNPGIMALDVDAGQVTQIGDLDDVHDGQVSPDGAWLVQSKVAEWPDEGVSVTLLSLTDGTERDVTCAEGAMVAGDFSFSPDNTWLAWREWATAPGGSMLLVRALRLPDGEPLTVCGDVELTAPQIGGWLGRDDLILVYPMQENGTGGHSTIVTLPSVGSGDPFSPFTFLGVVVGGDW